jgi:hypothetical protein
VAYLGIKHLAHFLPHHLGLGVVWVRPAHKYTAECALVGLPHQTPPDRLLSTTGQIGSKPQLQNLRQDAQHNTNAVDTTPRWAIFVLTNGFCRINAWQNPSEGPLLRQYFDSTRLGCSLSSGHALPAV